MMDCTDRHERFFLRLISQNTLLYTEMIVDEAINRGDKKKLLEFNINEKPVALQLGGSSPKLLANASISVNLAMFGSCLNSSDIESFQELVIGVWAVGCVTVSVAVVVSVVSATGSVVWVVCSSDMVIYPFPFEAFV